MQRLRLRFSRGPELKYISHLDLIRLWHRAFRRAGIELAYSEGFNPHPRIHLAAPLPLGVTAENELMDVVVNAVVAPHSLMVRLNRQLPPGVEVLQAMTVPVNSPSLQAQVRRAVYTVEICPGGKPAKVESSIEWLLNLESLPWSHMRQHKKREYDIREQIFDIYLADATPDRYLVSMELKCDSEGSGRPEQVVKALGLSEPEKICRNRLVLDAA